MTGRTWLLLSWILVGWILLVVHAVTLWQAVRAKEVDARWRWLALLPPAAPFVAWMGGRRVAPILWVSVAAVYVTLRFFES